MKKAGLLLAALALSASTLLAAAARTYQVTGPIVSMTNDTITVKKGNDSWEIGRDAATKTVGDLKVGMKVKIEYRMNATSIGPAEAKTTAKKK